MKGSKATRAARPAPEATPEAASESSRGARPGCAEAADVAPVLAASTVTLPARVRADAARNRARILAAAEAIFSAEGLAVPIDVVAERAGLGIGTLYRHFPTKEALFCAIVVDRFERLVGELETLSHAEDASAAFFTFIDLLVTQFALKKHLLDALGAERVVYDERMACAKNDFHRLLDIILARGQAAGGVRTDVTTDDVFRLVHGVFSAAGSDSAARARYIAVICAGMRAPRPVTRKPRPREKER